MRKQGEPKASLSPVFLIDWHLKNLQFILLFPKIKQGNMASFAGTTQNQKAVKGGTIWTWVICHEWSVQTQFSKFCSV